MSEEIARARADLAELARLSGDLRTMREVVEQRNRALEAAHAKIAMIEADNAQLWITLDLLTPDSPRWGARKDHPGRALLAELDAARAVVAAARTGFGTAKDIILGYAFDPTELRAAISAYDEATKARDE